jgi:GTP-binding protein HflX
MQGDRNGRTRPSRNSAQGDPPPRARQRAVAIGVMPEGDDLAELKELLRTAGVAVTAELVQHREQPHPNLYLGPGKAAELKALVESTGANLVSCDDELSPRQERNLEKELGVPVIDRTAVILDIFASHAHTAEGKLQVELAQLEYNLARMRGLWTHLERLGGGIGTRGPGESQIETDRRLARNRIASLRRRLDQVRSTRSVMRAERERAQLPTVALAGYTNAGKSTLLNRLTGASVGVRDRLFHTLDPTTRTMRLDGRTYLATDTVGFIRKLPHQLVDAFAATLEETRIADLILHVVDAGVAEEELVEMVRAVEDVLSEIGVAETPTLLVLNKADLLDEDRRRELAFRHSEGILVSAVTGEGLDELGPRVSAEFERRMRDVELLVPFSDGTVLSELHDLAGDLRREETAEGVRVSARLPGVIAERFERYAVGSDEVDPGSPGPRDGPAGETGSETASPHRAPWDGDSADAAPADRTAGRSAAE